jgi:thioesterase domain-containing protein
MQGDPKEVQQYLHDHIPMSKQMGIVVERADDSGVVLFAPLEPNINHRDTFFGGSASAVAILSAWTLLNLKLRAHPIPLRLVIQKNWVHYLEPIHHDLRTTCRPPGTREWDRFSRTLEKRGRARILLEATMECEGSVVGTFSGDYVAIGQGLP